MEQERIDLDDFLRENYLDYGTFVNNHRAVPGSDGLKPVHRRVLLGLKSVANGKLTGTVNAIGAIQNMHPYGEASCLGVLYDMARLGAVDSFGAVGVRLLEDVRAAASRYTKSGLTKEQSKFWFRLLEYSPQIESDVDLEPEYLIAPIPYCLVYGALNWGFGVLGRTPAFTYESLLEAYADDDPTKLKSKFGLEIVQSESDLESLWTKGIGNITYKADIVRVNEDEIVISGSGELWKPALGMLNKWVESGKIIILNESSEQISVRIRRVLRARVDMDEVYKDVEKLVKIKKNYSILISEGNQVKRISIRDWLELTTTRFINIYNQSKLDRISRLEHEIKVLSFLPVVGKALINGDTDNSIFKIEGMTEEILASIKRKSIGALRKKDTDDEIKSIEYQITSIKAEKAEEAMLNPM